jgi:hypothetical protein
MPARERQRRFERCVGTPQSGKAAAHAVVGSVAPASPPAIVFHA